MNTLMWEHPITAQQVVTEFVCLALTFTDIPLTNLSSVLSCLSAKNPGKLAD